MSRMRREYQGLRCECGRDRRRRPLQLRLCVCPNPDREQSRTSDGLARRTPTSVSPDRPSVPRADALRTLYPSRPPHLYPPDALGRRAVSCRRPVRATTRRAQTVRRPRRRVRRGVSPSTSGAPPAPRAASRRQRSLEQAQRLRSLAARARRSDAQAVFLCGLIDTSAGEVLGALRRALPASVPVIACNGVLPAALVFERAGPAARGTYVSLTGLANERLGPQGRRSCASSVPRNRAAGRHRCRVRGGSGRLLLDAIARSDGTRASVSSELFRARVHNGLLGSFAIGADGDPTPAPVTIVRLEHGGGIDVVESYEGARVERVIRPPRWLLGKERLGHSPLARSPYFPDFISACRSFLGPYRRSPQPPEP